MRAALEGTSVTKAGGLTVSNAPPKSKWTEMKKRTERLLRRQPQKHGEDRNYVGE